jgi:hypothetical protein
MNTDQSTTTCTHERQIQLLVGRSDAALRRGGTAGVLAAKMTGDEAMAACQAECGDASPYAGVELRPTTPADAAAMMRPYSIVEEFADMGSTVWRGARRFLGRTDTASKQAKQ